MFTKAPLRQGRFRRCLVRAAARPIFMLQHPVDKRPKIHLDGVEFTLKYRDGAWKVVAKLGTGAAAGATYAQPRSRSREPRSQYAADRRPARWLGISRPRGARLLRGQFLP
jgi:hypothetical protein